MRILCGTGFSKHARRAADGAALLAALLNATLLVIPADSLFRVPKSYRDLTHKKRQLCSEIKRLEQNGTDVHAIRHNASEDLDVINYSQQAGHLKDVPLVNARGET